MRFNRRNVNLLSFLITSFLIIMICIVVQGTSFMATEKTEENIIKESNNTQINIWEIKIPEIMINQKIVKENNNSNSFVHYKKSYIKNGTIILIGATTENPYFEVNKALISRSMVSQSPRCASTVRSSATPRPP